MQMFVTQEVTSKRNVHGAELSRSSEAPASARQHTAVRSSNDGSIAYGIAVQMEKGCQEYTMGQISEASEPRAAPKDCEMTLLHVQL